MDAKRFMLDQTTIKKLLTIFKLNIPDYQRNFVWKREKKRKLLDSLFRGFPIGAITLYEDEGAQAYYIIDGLQRINTLSQYLSRPNEIIPFGEFFPKVLPDIESFLQKNELPVTISKLKKRLEKWYKGLNELYAYEKMSILYQTLRTGNDEVSNAFENLGLVESLSGLLEAKIAIANDDIALIVYRGDKNDLPDLFKNINTGSVALSTYEILQAVWNDYLLDEKILEKTSHAYKMALTRINQEYEVSAKREVGSFDIFKSLTGLNHMICCREDCRILFNSNTFKKLSVPIDLPDGTKKYYENDGIAFEIYSTLLCGAPNKIAKTIDDLFHSGSGQEEISCFIADLNRIIYEAIDVAAYKIPQMGCELQDSKYHSLYILSGIIFSQYDIDFKCELSIKKTETDEDVLQRCLDLKRHRENKWFVDENRQVDFFNIKIKEILEQKKIRTGHTGINDKVAEDLLKISLYGEMMQGYTVKEFYHNIFTCLMEHGVNLDGFVPFATGRRRYLINRENHHIDGGPFVSPIKIGPYYVETHKSRASAIKDISHFLEHIGVGFY